MVKISDNNNFKIHLPYCYTVTDLKFWPAVPLSSLLLFVVCFQRWPHSSVHSEVADEPYPCMERSVASLHSFLSLHFCRTLMSHVLSHNFAPSCIYRYVLSFTRLPYPRTLQSTPSRNAQNFCSEFGRVTNEKGNLILAVSGECAVDSDKLIRSD